MTALEGAQAGLSWSTILAKRQHYRDAFLRWDVERIARLSASDVELLLHNTGIVRNRLKVQSVLRNAQAFLNVQAEFGSFDQYIWRFVGGTPTVNHWTTCRRRAWSTTTSRAVNGLRRYSACPTRARRISAE